MPKHGQEKSLTFPRPIVAIVVSSEAARQLNMQPPSATINLHVEAAQQIGITAYVVALRDCNPASRTVGGWIELQAGWRQRPLPWPDVFYEQFISAVGPRDKEILDHLYHISMPINTVRSLGKWFCHEVLSRSSPTKELLPDTVLYDNPQDMAAMLAKHPVVFAKPERGSGGQGISRVTATGKGLYRWEDLENGRSEEGLSFKHMLRRVTTGTGHSPFVIQEEIPLRTLDGRRGDTRITMIKNGSNEWCHTKSGIRLAQPGQLICNRKAGAESLPFPAGLDRFVGHPGNEELLERLFATAGLVVRHLEEHLGPMGEIGVDLALDDQLRIWFLEANAKPSKSVHSYRPGEPPPDKFVWVMDYAKYLWSHRQMNKQGRTISVR